VSGNELAALSRAHELFAGRTRPVAVDARLVPYDGLLERAAALNTTAGQGRYQSAVNRSRDDLRAAATADAAVAATVGEAHRDYANAQGLTKGVLDEARADTAVPDNPIAQREAIRRRVTRLRAQQAHVLAARRKSRRHRSRWRAVRYRMLHHGAYPAGLRLPPPNSRAGIAVRAALSRLGRPYVWGATGPDQFDCSGLTQWSYARAGIHLDRSTYQQIYDGIPIPRAHVRPGDLVFPTAGHVQLAIGNDLVVEAPHSGAAVRISPLGTGVQIRRPTG
jgi:peptidoglycan DL-endopeptidase CwlO